MYLCICNEIKESEFIHYVQKYPDMSFGDICQALGVGQECGGCIEYAYDAYRSELSKSETSGKIVL